jgi:hypothetical protein
LISLPPLTPNVHRGRIAYAKPINNPAPLSLQDNQRRPAIAAPDAVPNGHVSIPAGTAVSPDSIAAQRPAVWGRPVPSNRNPKCRRAPRDVPGADGQSFWRAKRRRRHGSDRCGRCALMSDRANPIWLATC